MHSCFLKIHPWECVGYLHLSNNISLPSITVSNMHIPVFHLIDVMIFFPQVECDRAENDLG